jgi:hypothetical protein
MRNPKFVWRRFLERSEDFRRNSTHAMGIDEFRHGRTKLPAINNLVPQAFPRDTRNAIIGGAFGLGRNQDLQSLEKETRTIS